MIRRRPLARMAVRTTVIAGTAAVVGGSVASRSAKSAQAAPAAAAPEAAPPAVGPAEAQPPQQAVAQDAPASSAEQLTQLAALRDAGDLTEDEFLAQKSIVLTH